MTESPVAMLSNDEKDDEPSSISEGKEELLLLFVEDDPSSLLKYEGEVDAASILGEDSGGQKEAN